ncbi:ribbon-helix-helix protein, CopG family [Thermaurantiacus sp.]
MLIDLPDDDVAWLDRAAAEAAKSRAALVREAVAAYRAERGADAIDRAFGIWKDRADIGDGLAYQQRLRAEWDDRG